MRGVDGVIALVSISLMGCGGGGSDAGTDSAVGTDSFVGTDAVVGTDAAPPIDCGADITLDVTVTDVEFDAPVSGMTVDVFAFADPTMSVASGTSDDNGFARVCLAAPVTEPFLRATGPGYKDSYFYVDDIDADRLEEVFAVSISFWDFSHSFLLIPPDPTAGVILGRVQHDTGMGAGDIVVTASGGGTIIYLDNGLPDGSLTETALSGEFGLYGVAPGLGTVLGVGVSLSAGLAGERGIRVFADSAHAIDVTVGPVSCGNGVLEPGETCDDANTTPGDGCDAVCQME